MTNHPLTAIPASRRPSIFWLLLGLTLVLLLSFNWLGRPLQSEAAPMGIVSLQFAGSSASAQAILDQWDDRAKIYAGFSLGLDFLFIFVYPTTIALACLWVAGLSRAPGWLRATAVSLAWGQLVAAGLDVVETAASFYLVAEGVISPLPELIYWTAVPKFALVVAGIAVGLSGLLFYRPTNRRQ
jgi:hypothetical protein